MDPNSRLEELRLLSAQISAGDRGWDLSPEAYRLADLFEALDDWLRKGGFFPHDWTFGVDQSE